MDLFSRGGSNSVLQADWQKVIPVILADWQLARDLGLLALASYAGKGEGIGTSADESAN
jgi:CRISPR-associated protein Cas8a1/Csx13